MLENLKEKIKEKIPIIFVVVMVIYLSALAAKTGMVYWEEYHKQDKSAQKTVQHPG